MDSRIVGVKGRNIIDDRKCMITLTHAMIFLSSLAMTLKLKEFFNIKTMQQEH